MIKYNNKISYTLLPLFLHNRSSRPTYAQCNGKTSESGSVLGRRVMYNFNMEMLILIKD